MPSRNVYRHFFYLLTLLAMSAGLAGCPFDGDDDDEETPPPVASSDADLASLTVSEGSLDPAFSSAVTDYAVTLAHAVESISVTATTSDASATLTVNGTATSSGSASTPVDLPVGTTQIDIVVTAEDGTTTKSYAVNVTREASSDASLSALELSATVLNESFDAAQNAYTADVENSVDSTTVTATASDASATIDINGAAVASGAASDPIPLAVGENLITVTVTAGDGTTIAIYTITITRAASSDAALSALDLGTATLDVAFDPDTTDYSASAPTSSDEVTVSATARDSAASIVIDGGTAMAGSATAVVPFSGASISIEVRVTAGNGTDSRVYNVVVTRSTPQVSTLDLIVLDHEGFAIEGAVIELDGISVATTDGDGRARIEAPAGQTSLVRVARDGYASQIQRVDLQAGVPGGQLVVGLRGLEEAVVLANAENGGTVTGIDGVTLTVPAGALVLEASGSPVVGGVDVFMSPVNVTDEREARAFPGMYAGIDEAGNETLIVSYGAADFRFEQNGAEVQLASGQTASIRIPVYPENTPGGTALSAGSSIALWSLDETTGLWQQEGSGTLVTEAQSPSGLALEAEVSHFSWWNCDQPWPGASLNFTVYCGSSGTPCTPPLPRVTATLQSATPTNPRFVGQVQLRADEVTSAGVAAGFPITLSATGGDGAFTADITPPSPFTVLAGMAQDVEIVLRPWHEGDGLFTPGTRLRGELIAVGDMHEYVFDSKGDELFAIATYAAENVRSELGMTGELGGRVTLLDAGGTELATAVFDAFQVARIAQPIVEPGRYTLRISAEGKVPGWYVAGTALRPSIKTTEYLKTFAGSRRFGSVLAASERILASPEHPTFQSAGIWDQVQVFEENILTEWRNVATLEDKPFSANTSFGEGLDIDVDTLAIGSPGEDVGRGAVYMFRRVVTDRIEWVSEGRIVPPNPDAGDSFGERVAVSGNTLVIGAPQEQSSVGGVGGDGLDNDTLDAGALYVYFRNAQNEWVFDTLIKPAVPRRGARFGGLGLDLDGDTLVVSESRGFGTEEVLYVFERTGVDWAQTAEFLRSETGFAEAIAVAGDRFVVGSRFADSRQGRVYVYAEDAGVWGQTATLSASNADDNDLFGTSVAFDGNTIAVGAPQEDSADNSDPANNTLFNGGAAYLFEEDATLGWTETDYLKPDILDSGDDFGRSISLGAGFVAVGAPLEDGVFGDPTRNDREESGAVYVIPR